MKHLYQAAVVAEVKQRLQQLPPNAQAAWGKMNPSQALAHCAASLQMALGAINAPRKVLGYVFGRIAKRSLIDRGEPMRRNSPTVGELVMSDDRDFVVERQRLELLIDRFVEAGPAGCTRHPHPFMGALTPTEWAALMYQHLDHHLRQFNT